MTMQSASSVSADATLLHELVAAASIRSPDRPSLTYGGETLDYRTLAARVHAFATGLMAIALNRSDRVGIYLEKRVETVVAMFGTAAAGGVFVPINPLLKADQVGYILRDCNVRVLVTSPERLSQLDAPLSDMSGPAAHRRHDLGERACGGRRPGASMVRLDRLPPRAVHRVIDDDMAAILYTSGSTGKPKGVVLSHRNMVTGAKSVASYLENCADDTLLAVLPLSFDAGLSQLTTAFHANARVVLLNHLLPIDVIKALARERITGSPRYRRCTSSCRSSSGRHRSRRTCAISPIPAGACRWRRSRRCGRRCRPRNRS